MSRPVSLYQWTKTGNYPAGANLWNGQPLALQPAGTYWTPNVPIDAEEMNWVLATMTANDEAILDWAGNAPAVNWWAPIAAASFTGTTELGSARWAPLSRQWVLAAGQHGTPQVLIFTSPGNGADGIGEWSSVTSFASGVNSHIPSIAEDGLTAGQYWFVISDTSNNQLIYKYPVGGPAALSHSNAGATFGPSEVVTANIGGASTIVVATAQATGALITYSLNGGSTWTDFATGVEVDRFYLGYNGSLFVAISHNNSVSSAAYWTSPDGHTWTARTLPVSVTGASGNRPGGLGWSDVLGQWVLIMNVIGGGLLTAVSPDAITWNVVSSVGGVSTPVMADLAVLGGLFIVTTQDSSGGPSNLYTSIDGGNSWHQVNAGFATNLSTATAYYTRTRVWASDMGYISLNSNFVRESLLAGVASSHL